MKRADLLRALEIVKVGLTSEEGTVEQGSSVVISDSRLYTYNDSVSVSAKVDGFAKNFKGAVHAKELIKLLGKLKAEDIEVELQDNEVIMKSGRAKAGFALQQEIKLPLSEIGKRSGWKELPNDFAKALAFVMTTCARHSSRPILESINIKKDGTLESTDNLRISIYKIGKLPVNSFLLPGSTAQILSNYNLGFIAEGQGWIHFKTVDEAVEFSCRIYDDEFPNVSKMLNVEGTKLELPAKTQEVLDRAAIFCAEKSLEDQKVIVSVSDKRMKMQVESDVSWFEEETNMAYKGKPVSFTINPSLLTMILNKTRVCTVGTNSLKFADGPWQHVVQLLAE